MGRRLALALATGEPACGARHALAHSNILGEDVRKRLGVPFHCRCGFRCAKRDTMIIEHFSVAPLGCNCVILGDETRGKAIVVDPGGEAPRILARLAELGLQCEAIVHTHAHFDHIGGTKAVQEATHASNMIHADDLFLYEGVQMQLDSFRAPFRAPGVAQVDRFVAEGDTVQAGGLELDVLHTPGHSPGSICLHLEGDRPVIIAGDTLFAQSIGRTDLWGGDMSQIVDSIRRKLFALPDETLVITGHGPTTTIGEERSLNPFVGSRGS